MNSAKNFSKAKSGIDGGVIITFTNRPPKCRRRHRSSYRCTPYRPDAAARHPATSQAQTVFKQNSLAFDVRTAAEEKIAYFRGVIAAVVEWIETEKNFA